MAKRASEGYDSYEGEEGTLCSSGGSGLGENSGKWILIIFIVATISRPARGPNALKTQTLLDANLTMQEEAFKNWFNHRLGAHEPNYTGHKLTDFR